MRTESRADGRSPAATEVERPKNGYFYCWICWSPKNEPRSNGTYPLALATQEEATELYHHFALLHALDVAGDEIRKHLPKGVTWRKPPWVRAEQERIRYHEREGSEKQLFEDRNGGVVISRVFRRRLNEFYIKVDASTLLLPSEARTMARKILAAVKGRRDWYLPKRRKRGQG